jgi:hypothetical protein
MLYIVNVGVRPERAAAWETWMASSHIPAVLETGAFLGAWLTRDPDSDSDALVAYRALYDARDGAALEVYLRDDAPRLRAEHAEAFGDDVVATRELLPVIARF